MNVYECRRFVPGVANSWAGAMIIAAESEDQAQAIFARFENRLPYQVVVWPDVMASGEPRVLCEFGPGMT